MTRLEVVVDDAGGAEGGAGGVHHDGEDAESHVDVHRVDVRRHEGRLEACHGVIARVKVSSIDFALNSMHRAEVGYSPPMAVYRIMPRGMRKEAA